MNDKMSAFIAAELHARGWSMREMARRANVSHTTIASLVNGHRKPTVAVCRGIARALSLPTEDVLRIAGLLPPLSEDWEGQYKQLRDSFKNLSPRAREEVVSYVTYKYQQEQEG